MSQEGIAATYIAQGEPAAVVLPSAPRGPLRAWARLRAPLMLLQRVFSEPNSTQGSWWWPPFCPCAAPARTATILDPLHRAGDLGRS